MTQSKSGLCQVDLPWPVIACGCIAWNQQTHKHMQQLCTSDEQCNYILFVTVAFENQDSDVFKDVSTRLPYNPGHIRQMSKFLGQLEAPTRFSRLGSKSPTSYFCIRSHNF